MSLKTMNAEELYHSWLRQETLPADLRAELVAISGDAAAIEDRFYRNLEFGTGGLRGVLGAGINRMNLFTVRRATAGFGAYLRQQAAADGVNEPMCVVGYDCRRMSREFAEEVGRVLAGQGIVTYVFEHLCPTPELSFAVRHLKAQGGVMVTASHNPPQYNGYKVYDKYGCQVLPDDAKRITDEIESVDDPFRVPAMALDEALSSHMFQWVGSQVDEAYTKRVVQSIRVAGLTQADRDHLAVVYTPLHGTGNLPVREALRQSGYHNVTVVPQQAEPDGEFSTVKSPNPEEAAALAMAVDLAKQAGADVAMGTDPDADRVGIAVRRGDGEYALFSGNQVGGLLVDFVLHRRAEEGKLPADGVVLKTIVTSELGAASARQMGVKVEDTLTGFKYIGDRIEHYEKTGTGTFLFGYEESYGYLAEGFVRDKDAVQICLLIAEMAAFHKRKGWTLLDALDDLYRRVGYFEERLISETLPGVEGVRQIGELMENLRAHGLSVPGMSLAVVEDYKARTRLVLGQGTDDAGTGTKAGAGTRTTLGTEATSGTGVSASASSTTEALTLPQADVLKYVFQDGSWLAVRPSGTEPKIKFYVGAKGESQTACRAAVERLQDAVETILEPVR